MRCDGDGCPSASCRPCTKMFGNLSTATSQTVISLHSSCQLNEGGWWQCWSALCLQLPLPPLNVIEGFAKSQTQRHCLFKNRNNRAVSQEVKLKPCGYTVTIWSLVQARLTFCARSRRIHGAASPSGVQCADAFDFSVDACSRHVRASVRATSRSLQAHPIASDVFQVTLAGEALRDRAASVSETSFEMNGDSRR